MITMTEDEYLDHCRTNDGLCIECGEINDSFHEPDAEGYPCYECGEDASMGIENALIYDYIDITEV